MSRTALTGTLLAMALNRAAPGEETPASSCEEASSGSSSAPDATSTNWTSRPSLSKYPRPLATNSGLLPVPLSWPTRTTLGEPVAAGALVLVGAAVGTGAVVAAGGAVGAAVGAAQPSSTDRL